MLQKENEAKEKKLEKENKAKEEKLEQENREALALKAAQKKFKDETVQEVFSRSERLIREENTEFVENQKRTRGGWPCCSVRTKPSWR